MALTKDHILHIARLARLKLTDEEIDKYTGQLSQVLDYMNILNEVDTSNVQPTYQVTGLESVMEQDSIKTPLTSKDELLGCSRLPVEAEQIRVRPVIN